MIAIDESESSQNADQPPANQTEEPIQTEQPTQAYPEEKNRADSLAEAPTQEPIVGGVDADVTANQTELIQTEQPTQADPKRQEGADCLAKPPTTEPIVGGVEDCLPPNQPQPQLHMPRYQPGKNKRPWPILECNGALHANLWNHIFQTHKA